MTVTRVVPNISSSRVNESREFYTSLFGFQVAMDMGWIVTLASPLNPTAQISFVRTEEPAARQDMVTLTIEVADVEGVHSRAESAGHEIVYPLTTEPWGVRRFHVRDPNGVVINVMNHVP